MWFKTTNELAFMNSLKMKIAVILGIAQMSMGICMKGLNAIHFGRAVDFIFEFLPQIILMLALFGYMDLLIVIKWLNNYDHPGADPPSIITIMIDIPLKSAVVNGDPLIGDAAMNQRVSIILLLIALVTIPIMTFPKPFIDYAAIKAENKHIEEAEGNGYQSLDGGNDGENDNSDIKNEHKGEKKKIAHNPKDHGFGEVFIHQLIESIEFILGTISNTASYLRLWALSLAHSQLAKVFYENTILPGLNPAAPSVPFVKYSPNFSSSPDSLCSLVQLYWF
jgi:V-type H+-transporting ATPase subunit a